MTETGESGWKITSSQIAKIRDTGKANDCILGLLHSAEGYAEAKKIELIFGKDVKVYKALIQELKSLKHYKY